MLVPTSGVEGREAGTMPSLSGKTFVTTDEQGSSLIWIKLFWHEVPEHGR